MAPNISRADGGGSARGSLSSLTGPPVCAYRKGAKLCAMNFGTPASRGGREQVVGALGPQLVRRREGAVHVAGEADAGQGGGLVDDRVGTGLADHGAHRAGVEHVEHGRLGAERPELPGLGGRPGGAGDLVAALGQLGNEAAADRAARAYHENSHDVFVPPYRRPAVTPGRIRRVTVTDTACRRERDRRARRREPFPTGGGWLAERFEEHRARLRAVAYRMLGSLDEADDAVQEAWVRFSAAGADEVVNLGGWLTTIVSRVCLNALRARAARPETLAGARVPDPVLSPADGPTPEQEALLADSVGLALLVVLDTLTPAERVAFVLHDVFDFPFGEIAPMLDRTPRSRQAAGQPGTAPGQGGGRARAGRRRRRPAGGGQRVLRRRAGRRPGRAGRAA